MKKLIALIMAVAMVLGLASCGAKKDGYTVGVCQLIQHPALDAATEGFQKALTDKLGDKVTFEVQVASGDLSTCSTVVNGLISKKVDLIMANATAALQAATSATKKIPVLGTSITDYATALELDNWNGLVGGNVSGTSDLAPLADQAAMIKEWFPAAKTVGLLYCSNESNSKYQVSVVAEELKNLGIASEEFTFTDSNDIANVTQMACSKVDVIYVPTDNTAANNTEAIANVVIPAGIPVIAGEEGICKGCGVATLSISYYDLGYATGEMAARVLQGEDISKMKIEYAKNVTKKYNKDMVEKLGLTVPAADYEEIAAE